METQTVQLTLGNETREVEISRQTPAHCWYASAPVIFRFRSGTKTHTIHSVQVKQISPGVWAVPSANFRNRPVFPVAFADVRQGNSGWTYNEVACERLLD